MGGERGGGLLRQHVGLALQRLAWRWGRSQWRSKDCPGEGSKPVVVVRLVIKGYNKTTVRGDSSDFCFIRARALLNMYQLMWSYLYI